MELTSRQRIFNSIIGVEVNRVPFSPFLAYYFDFLPEEIRSKGDFVYLKEMGADPLFRGGVCAYNVKSSYSTNYKHVGNTRYDTIELPKGQLVSEYTYVSKANTWYMTKHPVNCEKDLELAIDYFNSITVEENIEQANLAVRNLGEDGLQLAILGAFGKSAYQYLLENFIGTENLVYMTYDCPDKIEEVLSIMRKKDMETVEITAQSDVLACISWEDSSTTNVSPALYEKYIASEITEWCKVLSEVDKPYVQHACGHLKDLLPIMAKQGIACVESISPAPTGNVTIEEAYAILPKNVSIIGGIEPVQMLTQSVEELLEYSAGLINKRNGRGLVLGNSDSCPPGVEYEKFVALAKLRMK